METANQNVLITGVSSGIGHALAKYYLSLGASVFGTSRRTPQDLTGHSRFRFIPLDLQQEAEIGPRFGELLADVPRLDLAVLNAGILGRFGDLATMELSELRNTMNVNTWSNKLMLDAIFQGVGDVRQVVAISSGAAVNGHRGWSGYAISKAALNMLVKLYAAERTGCHFCAFAPGVVDTAMQDDLCGRTPDDRYPAIEILRAKRGTDEMPTPAAAAARLARAMARLPDLVSSGDYADIRLLNVGP